MPRPRKYDNEVILKIAEEVFLEQGAAATTALIAKRAGVSEGVLFQRFKTKESLFAAALTLNTDSNQWRKTLLDSVGKDTPEANLKKAILALFGKLERIVPKLMVLEGQGHQRMMPKGAKAPPIEDAKAITAYLRAEVKLGRLTIDRPEFHAHEIIGAVVHCTMLKLRHQMKVGRAEQWAEHLVDTHLAEASPKSFQ